MWPYRDSGGHKACAGNVGDQPSLVSRRAYHGATSELLRVHGYAYPARSPAIGDDEAIQVGWRHNGIVAALVHGGDASTRKPMLALYITDGSYKQHGNLVNFINKKSLLPLVLQSP